MMGRSSWGNWAAQCDLRVLKWGAGRRKAQNKTDGIMRKARWAIASFGNGEKEP